MLNASCYVESVPHNSDGFTILYHHRKYHSDTLDKVMKERLHPLKFAEAGHLGNCYI